MLQAKHIGKANETIYTYTWEKALFNFSKVLGRLHQFKMKEYDNMRLIFLVFSD